MSTFAAFLLFIILPIIMIALTVWLLKWITSL